MPKSIVSEKYNKARTPASHYLEVAQTDKETRGSIRTKSGDEHEDEEAQRETPSLEGLVNGKIVRLLRQYGAIAASYCAPVNRK